MEQQQLQLQQLQHLDLASRSGKLIGGCCPGLAPETVPHPGAVVAAFGAADSDPASFGHPVLSPGTAGRLARSACILPYRVAHGGNKNGGGVMWELSTVAALRCHASDWCDLHFREIGSIAGSDAMTGATAAATDAAYNDDLHPDIAATAAAAAGSSQAAATGPAMGVSAWVPAKWASSMNAAASDGRWQKSPMVAVALAAGEMDMQLEGCTAAGDKCDDVASADAGISKQHMSMLRAPDGSAARRNLHLLNLLGLPQEVCSLRVPVSEPVSEREPDRSVLGCNKVHAWALGILDGAVEEERDATWPPPCGFTYDFVHTSPMPQAAMTAEESYSLVDSGLGMSTSASVSTPEAEVHESRPPLTMQQMLLELHQQRQHRPTPVAVEVLNLLGSPTGVAPQPLGRAVPYIGDCVVSYIDSLEWNEGELGGSLQSFGADLASHPSANMFAMMFSEDEVEVYATDADQEVRAQCGGVSHTTDGGGIRVGAAAHGGGCPCSSCRRSCGPEGGWQWPRHMKEPLLTSLTTGAVPL
ncbi:hypothetical protein Vretimale_1858 [Volvox reticuliferus]|uniref:Uncharacterized protein n=1 Tax=Volvox reticuliferus TaxID=1737510 RepID=A0A8J4FWI2_9CHLO|nr:hypothetical protein Vretifemale_17413 [Volvox reticuliferus]GIL95946.1 hypothetical protein Vretimale_1858 [Volvox reticuliferus]